MVGCTHCQREKYDDHPKHTIDIDCILGLNADTGEQMVLCWDCRPLYDLIANEKSENTFRLKGDE